MARSFSGAKFLGPTNPEKNRGLGSLVTALSLDLDQSRHWGWLYLLQVKVYLHWAPKG